MKISVNRHLFIWFFSLYFAYFLNIPFWHQILDIIKLSSVADLAYLLSASIILPSIFAILFYLFVFPYFGKFIIFLMTFIAVFSTYHMHYFKVEINADMIRNVLHTDFHEAFDLLNVSFFLWFSTLVLLPFLSLYFCKIHYHAHFLKEIKSRLISILLCIALIGCAFGISYKNIIVIHRNHRNLTGLVTPLNCFYSLGKYIRKQHLIKKTITPIAEDASRGALWKTVSKKTLLIIVVGEAARSDHFSLNGYLRETNPLLKTKNVISLKEVFSCDTSTAAALPGIFSKLSQRDYSPEKAAEEENLLDVLQRVGFLVYWKDNNSSSKGVASRVREENVRDLNQNDDILLKGLDEYVKSLKEDTVLILHQLGSHGPSYYKRYPSEFNIFTPTCNSSEIQSCQKDHLINTYDNTILYTDYILTKIIEVLEKNPQLNTVMMYISDHGQSLGEYGLYLHGTPYVVAPKEQIHIPWIIWLSDNFAKEFHVNKEHLLKSITTRKCAHENFFHSVLGLLNIDTEEYKKDMDIFGK